MPELPEVQTTVNGIAATAVGLTIVDAWTDYDSKSFYGKQNIKHPEYFKEFKQAIIGATIIGSKRIGKNVLILLSNNKTILTHMKMTGHYMYGKYKHSPIGSWIPVLQDGPLHDPFNRHIHLVFSLNNGYQLAFSDARKFAKIFIFDTDKAREIADVMHLGPDALSPSLTFDVFLQQLYKKPHWPIKKVLLDQEIIAGIGNIYSDEMLFASNTHPLSVTSKIPDKNLKLMYESMKPLLEHGINFGGDSTSDYRNIYGEPGKFQNTHKAYRRTGEKCSKKNCGGIIKRIIVGARSAHFCSEHQELFK
jgi:formamidopyrimidine-DNA glycosylase